MPDQTPEEGAREYRDELHRLQQYSREQGDAITLGIAADEITKLRSSNASLRARVEELEKAQREDAWFWYKRGCSPLTTHDEALSFQVFEEEWLDEQNRLRSLDSKKEEDEGSTD